MNKQLNLFIDDSKPADTNVKTNEIIFGDSHELIKQIADNSIDAIVTDPPYLYLDHELDAKWNEDFIFSQFKRVLKKDGMIAIFGRGEPFYRWNTKLADLGFVFKEEIVWDKDAGTSPVTPVQRRHETLSILGLGNSKIRKSFVPYEEVVQFDLSKLEGDINRLRPALKNQKTLDALIELINQENIYNREHNSKFNITFKLGQRESDRKIHVINSLERGYLERDVIKCKESLYGRVHPTQKPVRLMERIINLVSDDGDTILDPFAGSGSTLVGAKNTKRNYIGFEILKEFYDAARARLL